MSSPSLFSVLISNYNNGSFLGEAIDSVIEQTWKNWEIILVDDGSTDQSLQLYDKYKKDHRIKIFYNGVNKGCGYTKRKCVELASGELCGFLDADDVLLPLALEVMAEAHLAHPEASAVHSRCYYCDVDLNITGTNKFPDTESGKSYLEYGEFLALNFSSFKKSFYEKTAGISPVYRAGIDQDLYFKLEEVGPCRYIEEFTYKYRINNNSVTFDGRKTDFWNLLVKYDACIRRGLDPEEQLFSDFCRYLSHYYKSEEEMARVKREMEEVRRLRNSRAYRLGKFLLNPLKGLKTVIR